MNDSVHECNDKDPKRANDFATAVGMAFEHFSGKEAFHNVLTQSREEFITHLDDCWMHEPIKGQQDLLREHCK